jgi:ribose-phosphate pyrophosphokinase
MTMSKYKNIQILTGNANPALAGSIADYLGMEVSKAVVKSFSDKEIGLSIAESVRGADCYVIQPTCTPVNDHIMELLIMIDCLRRASASRITAVMPYYGYARQDRKTKSREPITARLVANLITKAGASRVVTFDLHAGQIQGFFDVPVDHLTGVPLLSDYIKRKNFKEAIVVSPDIGGVSRARVMAERLHLPLAIIDKRRPNPNVAEVMHIIGSVADKTAIILDDIIDTAGTVTMGAEALMKNGAREVYVCGIHGVLSGPAIDRIKNSVITEVIMTDTIPLSAEKRIDKIHVLSAASLIGEAIIRIHEDVSLSQLFI